MLDHWGHRLLAWFGIDRHFTLDEPATRFSLIRDNLCLGAALSLGTGQLSIRSGSRTSSVCCVKMSMRACVFSNQTLRR